MNVFHTLSKRQAVLLCALIGRQSWSGGRKCYSVRPAYTADHKQQMVGGKRVWVLTFDQTVWENTHKNPAWKPGISDNPGFSEAPFIGVPPTADHILGFIQGVSTAGGGSVSALSYTVLGA